MTQRFYQKASVQVAIATAIGLTIVTTITIAHQRSQLRADNQKLLTDVTVKTAEIQRLETLLTPFRTIALEKFTGDEKDALRKLADYVIDLRQKDVERTRLIGELTTAVDKAHELAAPPTLFLNTVKITTNSEGYVLHVVFRPSKEYGLGLLRFRVQLISSDNARITDLWPDETAGFRTADDSKSIAEDGRSANLFYSDMGHVWPRIRINVNRSCTACLVTDNGEKPFIIEIK